MYSVDAHLQLVRTLEQRLGARRGATVVQAQMSGEGSGNVQIVLRNGSAYEVTADGNLVVTAQGHDAVTRAGIEAEARRQRTSEIKRWTQEQSGNRDLQQRGAKAAEQRARLHELRARLKGPSKPVPGPKELALDLIGPAPRKPVDPEVAELRDEVALQRELVRLEAQKLELQRERLKLRDPWWVRLLRWLFRRP
jgi:hypothetical protein